MHRENIMPRFYLDNILILIMFLIFTGCSLAKTPMKTYSSIDIPDGEFLHYVVYSGGEKIGDSYMVIKKGTGPDSRLLYRIYKNEIRISSGKSLPGNYRDWPSYCLIDPRLGSVLEWEETYDTNTEIFKENEALFYPYYFQFHYNYNRGYVDEIIKSVKGKETTSARYHVAVNPDFPVWDQINFSFFGPSFMDVRSGGIIYMVAPFMLKEAAPVTFKYQASETITTKAGNFRALKETFLISDPFIGNLMDSFLKTSKFWIEDSGRKLLLKSQLGGTEVILEGISNINLK